MKHLYAPWRTRYTTDVAHTKNEGITEEECIFCHQFKEGDDEKNFILKRFKNIIVILNKFPYNAGHLLLLPKEHLNCLNDLPKDVRQELIEVANESIEILKEVMKAEGINAGMNFGKASGAGIPAHLHMHILPRWIGDTNFLPALAETKQISVDLNEVYEKLKPKFDNLKA